MHPVHLNTYLPVRLYTYASCAPEYLPVHLHTYFYVSCVYLPSCIPDISRMALARGLSCGATDIGCVRIVVAPKPAGSVTSVL
eukprot:1187418-Prorocentrum_minimum.AAC.8